MGVEPTKKPAKRAKHTVQGIAGGGMVSESVARVWLRWKSIALADAAAKKAAAAVQPAAAKKPAPSPSGADKPVAGEPSAAAGKKQPTKKAKGSWRDVPQGHTLE
eukprot:5654781-Pleurochrysis_carterae.AAC.1